MNSFNIDLSDILSSDELTTIDAGAVVAVPSGVSVNIPTSAPGYTEATIIWSQIP